MIKKILKSLVPNAVWKKLKSSFRPSLERFNEYRHTKSLLENRQKSIAVYMHIPTSIHHIRDTLINFKKNNYSIYIYSETKECIGLYIEFLDEYVKAIDAKLKYIRFPLVLTSATGMPEIRFNNKTTIAHMFHSIVSVHDIYHPHAFNFFDVICCVGPHHNTELKYLLKENYKKQFTLNTGYENVDRYSKIIRDSDEGEFRTILFAPSWHEENILRLQGEEIIERLIGTYHVILRPHPISLTKDKDLIASIMRKFGSGGKLILDDSTDASESFRKSDTMIADYSGVAMEFALSQLKPVVYINGPKKSFHQGWRKIYNKDGIQVEYRSRLGYIVDDLNKLNESIKQCAETREQWKIKLKNLRPELVYNFTNCSNVAYKQLSKIIQGDLSELQLIN